jgi:hypothetical protein
MRQALPIAIVATILIAAVEMSARGQKRGREVA